MNELYVTEDITEKHTNDPYGDTLWVCAYAPYILCKQCPLYYGLKGSCCEPIGDAIGDAISEISNRYSLYVNLSNVIDCTKVPSKKCQWSGWYHLKPVSNIIEKEILS